MKSSKINKDIYKFSQTLYGAERFKLLLEGMKKMEEGDKAPTADQLPPVDVTFSDKKELDDYRKISITFYVLNFVVFPMLKELFWLCNSFLILIHKIKIDGEFEPTAQKIVKRIEDFFKLVVAIEEINTEYGVDLLTFFHRQKIEKNKEFLSYVHEVLSIKMQITDSIKINGFTDEEMASTRHLINSILGAFYAVAMLD